MTRKISNFLAVTGMLLSSMAVAQTPAPATGAPTTTQANTALTKQTCPTVAQLQKKGLIWGAAGGWQSFSESFVTTIKSFRGAQWVGINYGKVICIYKGDDSFTFPVSLEQKEDYLIPTPSGDDWGSDRGGYKNCKSKDPSMCPFFVETKQQPTDIYEELDFYKDKKYEG